MLWDMLLCAFQAEKDIKEGSSGTGCHKDGSRGSTAIEA